jgi:4-hydroxy-3-methylbut-2-enyl diphosphate reductase
LLENEADLAIVIGGYNSSNTSHLVELLENKFTTFFISDSGKIESRELIKHFDMHRKSEVVSSFLPGSEKVRIAVTSGASCPDSIVDEVLNKILSFYDITADIDVVIENSVR